MVNPLEGGQKPSGTEGSKRTLPRRRFLQAGGAALVGTALLGVRPGSAAGQEAPPTSPEDAPPTEPELQPEQQVEVNGLLLNPVLMNTLADGPYIQDPTSYNNRTFTTNSGASAFLSQKAVEAFVVETGTDPQTISDVDRASFANKKWSGLLTEPANSYVIAEEGVYSFAQLKDGPMVVTLKTPDGQTRKVNYETTNLNYKPQTKYLEGLGLVGTDGFRVTHKYDASLNKWTELADYILMGTGEERIKNSLNEYLNASVEDKGSRIQNPLGLDPNEVAQYINGVKKDGFKSFQLLKNSKGEPSVILVTGGKYGLKPDLKNAEATHGAVNRLNQIDSSAVDNLVKLGLRAVAGDTPPQNIANYPSYYATFNSQLGIIKFNEINFGSRSPIFTITTLLAESRGIYNERHTEVQGNKWVFVSPSPLGRSEGLDKSIYLQQWAERNKSTMTPDEYKLFTETAQANIEFYSKFA